MKVLRIIAAFLLPPVAVIGYGLTPFLITLVLTLLGWLPGIIAAFYYIFTNDG